MGDRVLIAGASARAAAASARRAGLTPFAVDLFADADTERLCERVWRCPPDRYPFGLVELAEAAPPMPWLYTGGLENHPDVVAAISAGRELWGNGPDVLRRVRDPFALSALLAGRTLEHAEPLRPGGTPRRGVVWLRKPVGGAGGAGVRLADPDELSPPGPGDGHFLQEYIPGPPMSGLFAGPTPLGLTAQLIGTPWLHAGPFRYAGNVGPVAGPPATAAGDVPLTAHRLWAAAGARGLLGIDFIPHGGRCYTIEVNPRYPASVEVLEHATGTSLLRRTAPPPAARSAVGKGVYYAPHRLAFPPSGPWDESLARAADVWRRPDFADLPHPGAVVEPGHPVLTILVEADDQAGCLARLQSQAAALDRLFAAAPLPPS